MALRFLGGIDGRYSGGDERSKNNQGFWTTNKTFTRSFYVLGDSINNTEEQILNCPGVPQIGQTIGTAFCIRRRASETNRVIGAGCLWEVECEFDSNVDADSFPSSGSDGEDDQENPTLLPSKVRWYGETGEILLTTDREKKPIVTSANEPIAVMGPSLYVIFELTRYSNYPANPNIILQYQNTTNQNTFYGSPAGSALMAVITLEEEDVNGTKYILETYQVRVKIERKNGSLQADAWNVKPLDRGTMFRPAPNAPPQKKEDANGNLIPVNLKADGTENNDLANPHFLDFQIYEKKSWGPLNIEI